MLALKRLAIWDEHDGKPRCWFKCGMGGLRPDGSVLPNSWNVQPAPIVEPLVTYWLATGDAEGLAFAKAYAEGIMTNAQPGGIRFAISGKPTGGFDFGPHSHATMHAVWGIAHFRSGHAAKPATSISPVVPTHGCRNEAPAPAGFPPDLTTAMRLAVSRI